MKGLLPKSSHIITILQYIVLHSNAIHDMALTLIVALLIKQDNTIVTVTDQRK